MMNSVTRFITQKLQLKVNETKSAVARPQERKFLGFSFTNGPAVKRAIAPKALVRFKDRIREITRRAEGVSIKSTVEELARYMVGWRGYFGFCENTRGADLPHSLGTAQASMRPLAAVEDHAPSSGGIVATWGTHATGNQHCWNWSWLLVPGPRQSPFCRAFQCILPLARSSFVIRELLA